MNNKQVMALVWGIGAAALVCPTPMVAEAADSVLQQVELGNWSYAAINTLIESGKLAGYSNPIPTGYGVSRLEMAVIVDAAQQSRDKFDSSEKEIVDRLSKEYFYDVNKVKLLHSFDRMDQSQLPKVQQQAETGTVAFTAQDKAKQDKMSAFLDRFEMNGHARIRNDHKNVNGVKSTISNHIDVDLVTKYKINDNWKFITDMDYRHGMDNLQSPSESGFNGDEAHTREFTPLGLYLQGRMSNGIGVKAGRWNEWTPQGWGFDMDCDVTGFQIDFGKKLHTTISALDVNLWDNYAVSPTLAARGYSGRWDEKFTGIRFDYPVDEKTEIHFGGHWMSPMASRFQQTDQNRVFYYYIHGSHKFDKNWLVRGGIIHSNAKSISKAINNQKDASHIPGLWFDLQYKNIDLQKPGTYDIWAEYRREPGLTMPTVTDWWDNNYQGIRLGFDYVMDKNFMFTTWMNWCREIDTGLSNKRLRFQVDVFF